MSDEGRSVGHCAQYMNESSTNVGKPSNQVPGNPGRPDEGEPVHTRKINSLVSSEYRIRLCPDRFTARLSYWSDQFDDKGHGYCWTEARELALRDVERERSETQSIREFYERLHYFQEEGLVDDSASDDSASDDSEIVAMAAATVDE